MKRICRPVAVAAVAMMGALPVAAQERLEINNIYPKSEESFTLEDSIYYMQIIINSFIKKIIYKFKTIFFN